MPACNDKEASRSSFTSYSPTHNCRHKRLWSKISAHFPPRFLSTLLLLFCALPTPCAQVPSSPTVQAIVLSPAPSESQLIPGPSTLAPTSSYSPTVTTRPSFSPSKSTRPSSSPTNKPSPQPTTTPFPTISSMPSDVPSTLPSSIPSSQPTLETISTVTAYFRQRFAVGNGQIFSGGEITLFQVLYESYTFKFIPAGESGRTNTSCKVISVTGANRKLRNGVVNAVGRSLQSFLFSEVDFSMSYTSKQTNVTDYPIMFQNYVNDNLDTVTQNLQALSFNVTGAGNATMISFKAPSSAPTNTQRPSNMPTAKPIISWIPSQMPSDQPSLVPTKILKPTMGPSKSTPTLNTLFPTPGPTAGTSNPGGVTSNTVIVVSVVVAGSIILIGLVIYYRRRKKLRDLEFQSSTASGARKTGGSGRLDEGSWSAAVSKPSGFENTAASNTGMHGNLVDKDPLRTGIPLVASGVGMVSPSESHASNQSLLSAGNSMTGDSGDEADTTQNLADEFDQYKDQNLERMRSDVEGNLTGFDGMMSQALTKALIDDDETHVDPGELLWGGSGKLSGAEIEASALGEVTDWLKRKDNASLEAK